MRKRLATKKNLVLGCVLAMATLVLGCPPLPEDAQGDYVVEWGRGRVTVGNENPTEFLWDAERGAYTGEIMWGTEPYLGVIDATDPGCVPDVYPELGIVLACLCTVDPDTGEPSTLCESNLEEVSFFHLIRSNDATIQLTSGEADVLWEGKGTGNQPDGEGTPYTLDSNVWIPRAGGTPQGFWIYAAASQNIHFTLARGADGTWATAEGADGSYELGLDIAIGWTFLGAGTHIRYERPFSLVQQ